MSMNDKEIKYTTNNQRTWFASFEDLDKAYQLALTDSGCAEEYLGYANPTESQISNWLEDEYNDHYEEFGSGWAGE